MALLCLRLNPMLREHLTLIRGCTLNELVTTTIEQERLSSSYGGGGEEEEALSRPTGGAPSKYRLVCTPPSSQPRGQPPSQ
jgi:hypothetical protein